MNCWQNVISFGNEYGKLFIKIHDLCLLQLPPATINLQQIHPLATTLLTPYAGNTLLQFNIAANTL